MRGIVIACPEKYELICLNNIYLLRHKYNCHLPIEIWEIGTEITNETRKEMKMLNVTFKNVKDYCENPDHWKGFQVKVFALHHCEFTEAILCDADMTFHQSPEIIYQDENYRKTGAYFFRDYDWWQFHNLHENTDDKFQSLTFFNKRKAFIKKCLPQQTELFPKEWAYIYDDAIPNHSVKEALQESGVVYINKTIHKESLEHIFRLNENHADTYEYVWGDKETFWIGCVMANKPYHFNDTAAFRYTDGCLTHAYKNQLFWKQK